MLRSGKDQLTLSSLVKVVGHRAPGQSPKKEMKSQFLHTKHGRAGKGGPVIVLVGEAKAIE